MIQVKDFLRAIQLFTNHDGTNRRVKLNLILWSTFFAWLFLAPELKMLVMLNNPLCWRPVLIGIYTAVELGLDGVGTLAGGRLEKWIPAPWLMIFGDVMFMAQSIYMTFVRSTAMMFFG